MSDVEELERELLEAGRDGWAAIAVRHLASRMLTALKEAQALHKAEQQTTTVMINGLTNEIARLRKAIEDAPHEGECPTIFDESLCRCWKKAALEKQGEP